MTHICENGALSYHPDGTLKALTYCTEPGTEERAGRGGARWFCPEHARALDLFSARLKLRSLELWDARGHEWMRSCGHTLPVLTPQEIAALAGAEVSA